MDQETDRITEDKTLPEGVSVVETPSADGRKKTRRRVLAVAAAVLFALAAFAAGWMGSVWSRDGRVRELEWMLGVIEEYHYRELDPDAVYESIYDAAMPDRFSNYYTADEYAVREAEREGVNEGVGISLLQSGEEVHLYKVTENSPAQRAGLCRGMAVAGFGAPGEAMRTGSASEVVEFIGEQQDAFVLYISAGEEDPVPYTLRKERYHAAYCVYGDSASYWSFRGDEALTLVQTGGGLEELDKHTAYIRLDAFDGNCAEEFAACLEKMKERGRSSLILDLRGNGGGYLSDLQSIASHLLRNAAGKSPLVAYAQYRSGKRVDYFAAANDYAEYFSQDSNIKVLADQNSASASECLIGAMIDYGTIGYGDIFLRKDAGADGCATYGKGVMQSTFRSPDGGALQLTVAAIYWPNGNCIHGRGITEADGAVGVEAPLLQTDGEDALLRAAAESSADV